MMTMIASARETYAGDIVAWDLGLSADEIDDFVMHQGPNLELRTFNYSAYPAQIQAPGATSASLHTYAWKPAIIHEMLQEAEQVLWIDAGSLGTQGLSYTRLHIARTGFFGYQYHRCVHTREHAQVVRRTPPQPPAASSKRTSRRRQAARKLLLCGAAVASVCLDPRLHGSPRFYLLY